MICEQTTSSVQPLTKSDDKLKEVVELLKFMQKNPSFLTMRMLDVAIGLAESED